MEAQIYPDWRDLVTFSDQGHRPKMLVATETFKSVIVGLLPGQSIPPHIETLGMYHILEGKGWVIVDEERIAVQAGATVVIPDGAARGIEAETRLAFLAARPITTSSI